MDSESVFVLIYKISSNYVSNDIVAVYDLLTLIKAIYQALANVSEPAPVEERHEPRRFGTCLSETRFCEVSRMWPRG